MLESFPISGIGIRTTLMVEFTGSTMSHPTGMHLYRPHYPPLARQKASDMDRTKDAGDDRGCPLGETLMSINMSALHYMSDGFIKPSIGY